MQNLENIRFLYTFPKILNYLFLKPVQWGPKNSIYMDGWTDIHHEPNIRFTEICEVLHTVLSVIYPVEKSPSTEANRFSVSQETTLILWNPKFITAVTSAENLSLS
jgi:hypothetical protein